MAQSKQISRAEPWHDKLMEWLILHPERSRRECAEEFEVSYCWLSMVINSDLFREKLALRQEKHAEFISRSVVDQAQALAEQSMDVLSDRLETGRAALPIGEIREIASLALRTLGLGGSAATGHTQVINANSVNVLSVDGAVLERARARMRENQERVIEAEHTVLPALESAAVSG